VKTRVVTLVGCSKDKLKQAAPAREMYISRQFVASMALAAELGHPVRILSALYGVLELDTVIDTYDVTKIGADWGGRVLAQLGELKAGRLVVLAGVRYSKPLAKLKLYEPLEGLELGERFVETRDMLARLTKARGERGLFACSLCERSYPCWIWRCLACGSHGMDRLEHVGATARAYESDADEDSDVVDDEPTVQLPAAAMASSSSLSVGQLDMFGGL
jgi:hypothetical protein